MERPTTQVSQPTRPAQRLVIFDDDSILLARFTQQYRERGYDVTPVLVADGGNDDLIQGGRILQGSSAPATDADAERHTDPTRTVANELKLAKAKVNANPTKQRFAVDLDIYEAMQGFTYGVKSKDEVRALLKELKPDAVLSDMQMRRPEDPDMSEEDQARDPDTIMGDHIMAIAAGVLPNAPRAIHTGQYTITEELRANWTNDRIAEQQQRYATLCARHDATAQAQGYRVFAKDEKGADVTADAIDAYFKAQLARGAGRTKA